MDAMTQGITNKIHEYTGLLNKSFLLSHLAQGIFTQPRQYQSVLLYAYLCTAKMRKKVVLLRAAIIFVESIQSISMPFPPGQ